MSNHPRRRRVPAVHPPAARPPAARPPAAEPVGVLIPIDDIPPWVLAALGIPTPATSRPATQEVPVMTVDVVQEDNHPQVEDTPLRRVQETLAKQGVWLGRLEEEVRRLNGRVIELEDMATRRSRRASSRRELDSVNRALVDYLTQKVPGIWLTPAAIAANLAETRPEAVEHRSVADRLTRLAREGYVELRGGGRPGSQPMYRGTPKPAPAEPDEADEADQS